MHRNLRRCGMNVSSKDALQAKVYQRGILASAYAKLLTRGKEMGLPHKADFSLYMSCCIDSQDVQRMWKASKVRACGPQLLHLVSLLSLLQKRFISAPRAIRTSLKANARSGAFDFLVVSPMGKGAVLKLKKGVGCMQPAGSLNIHVTCQKHISN